MKKKYIYNINQNRHSVNRVRVLKKRPACCRSWPLNPLVFGVPKCEDRDEDEGQEDEAGRKAHALPKRQCQLVVHHEEGDEPDARHEAQEEEPP